MWQKRQKAHKRNVVGRKKRRQKAAVDEAGDEARDESGVHQNQKRPAWSRASWAAKRWLRIQEESVAAKVAVAAAGPFSSAPHAKVIEENVITLCDILFIYFLLT